LFTVKKLKITGFKSFAHTTEILIEDGVTGIIGPNGCGKSNIFEAIRWVMGESSSKSLRSNSQDDIIFNGTQNIPAKNFAEVSLELDDFEGDLSSVTDTSEKKIVISRLLERGVGSFFKINNKDARAKDVSIMFYDSGSGARSSSIISQGNIDQIINYKPIDRKIILEDAAGTSGLQARRHESELKLHSTEANLEKIDLNLNNLHDSQKSLSRQSRQAERYEEISREIKYLQSTLLFLDWKRIEENIKIDYQKKNSLEKEVTQIINSFNKQKSDFLYRKEQLENLQKNKEVLNQNLYKFERTISELKSKIENITNKRNEIVRFLETIKKDKYNEQKNLEDTRNYIKKVEKELSKSNDLNAEKEKLRELDAKEREVKNQIKKLETLYVNEIQLTLGEEFKSDNLKENKENLVKRSKNIYEELSKLNEMKKNDEINISTTSRTLEKLKESNKRIHLELVEKKNEIENCNKKKSQLSNDIQQLVEKIEVQSRQLAEKQTEIKTLNLIIGENSLTKDSIVNLLKIKEGYENAVFAALSHELDAKLKKSTKRWVQYEPRNLSTVDNSLSNFVEAPKELEPLLSQIMYIDDANQALKMQGKLEAGQLIVSRDGTIWRWDGFISEDNLQKKKLIDSQLKINELSESEKKISLELFNLEKIKTTKSKEENVNSERTEKLNYSLEKLYKELDINSPKISKYSEQISIFSLNLENNLIKIKNLTVEQNEINSQLNEIKTLESSSSKNSKNESDNVQNKISDLDEGLDEIRNQINTLKQKLMKEELNKTYYQNDLSKSKKRCDEALKRLSILDEREEFYNKENSKLDLQPSDITTKIKENEGNYNEINDQIKKNQDQQNELLLQLNNDEKFLNKVDKERETKKNQILVIETNVGNYNANEKELRSQIYEKTKLQPEELKESLNNNDQNLNNHADIRRKLDKLTYQREQMGPVNLRAKLEEDEVKKSIDHLELEKDDLVQAIEKLRIAINKINHEGRKRLVEAFEKVDRNFTSLFKKLFDGGEAKLELIKSDDPLHTGIEIYARPPGKKLSSLSLLSGGEKTLTAISLIFSIFLINPSPMCILDEVDAALDEINVQKFCKLLDELKNSTKTKFLIITHNKITMSSLDRVYGVTMAQKGISDVVSVDFKDGDLKKAV